MSDSSEPITYRHLLHKAWPIILANASVPLLGLVDTAVIGNISGVADLGGIAVGALIFSFVYWAFGFLRMATTGYVAQAEGAGQPAEVRAIIGRALLLALMLSAALLILQFPIHLLAFSLFSASDDVELVAESYFQIRIWGAPATLSLYVAMGMLVGQGRSGTLLLLQLFLNGLNAALDVLFAGYFAMGAAGIALGTIVAEWAAVGFAYALIFPTLRRKLLPGEAFWDRAAILDRAKLRATLLANSDIMIRTLLLIFSFAWFTNQSARFSDVTLAANHILLQLISFSAFFLDGYAFVVEALVGRSLGARDYSLFKEAVKKSTQLAFVSATLLALLLYLLGAEVINLLTDLEPVRAAAQSMLFFAAIYVFFSFAAFQLDGIFIGASLTQQMRNAALISIAVFMLAWWLLTDRFGVAGLWWAMIIYVCARADALLLFYPVLRKRFTA